MINIYEMIKYTNKTSILQKIISIVFLCLSLPTFSIAQVTVEIGDGTSNTGNASVTPFSASYTYSKTAILVLAEELHNAGIGQGNITKIGFNIDHGTTESCKYYIWVGHISNNSINSFQNGLTRVYYNTGTWFDYFEWNYRTFSTPFYWNGVDNIVFQITIEGLWPDSYGNADVYYTETPFNSVYKNYTSDDTYPDYLSYSYGGTSADEYTGNEIAHNMRPNMRITGESCIPNPNFTLNSYSETINKYETYQIQAVNPNTCYIGYSYSSGDNTVATVDSDGLITATGVGSTQITIENNGGVSQTLTVTVPQGADVSDIAILHKLYEDTKGEESWAVKWDLDGYIPELYGVTVANNRVTGINLEGNGLDGIVPIDIIGLTALSNFDISNNAVTSIPDMTTMYILDGNMDVSYNKLTFAHIEPNFNMFSSINQYNNQANFDLLPENNITILAGDELQITLTGMGGPNNEYTWYKNGAQITGDDIDPASNSFTLDDYGTYYCEVNNSVVDDITLTSNPLQLDIDYLVGDVDNDQKVLVHDAALVLKYSVEADLSNWGLPDFDKWEDWRLIAANAADIAPVVAVDEFDAIAILRYVIGLYDALPVDMVLKSGDKQAKIKLVRDGDMVLFYPQGHVYALTVQLPGYDVNANGEPTVLDNNFIFIDNKQATGYTFAMASAVPAALGQPILKLPLTQGQSETIYKVGVNAGQIHETPLMGYNGISTAVQPGLEMGHCHIYPNPFTGAVNINITCKANCMLSVKIYGMLGHHIATLFNGTAPNVQLGLSWDGTDSKGGICKNGMYLCEIMDNNNTTIYKLIKQ